MINTQMYRDDVNFGLSNEEITAKHIELFLITYLKISNIKIRKYKNANSIFDWKVEGYNCLIELKSRRNDFYKYPTQLVGHNKIIYGRNKMKENNTEVFYFFLLEGVEPNTKELYLYVDSLCEILKVKRLGNFARGDKASNLCLIPNDKLIYCSTFSF